MIGANSILAEKVEKTTPYIPAKIPTLKEIEIEIEKQKLQEDLVVIKMIDSDNEPQNFEVLRSIEGNLPIDLKEYEIKRESVTKSLELLKKNAEDRLNKERSDSD